mmetsp:Transcript_60560/g.107989  ORF Transcript_60560/g.107989 Transcript_60560/m.107989 type:complete len:300 (+) Transcript_60560:648-1547(+)
MELCGLDVVPEYFVLALVQSDVDILDHVKGVAAALPVMDVDHEHKLVHRRRDVVQLQLDDLVIALGRAVRGIRRQHNRLTANGPLAEVEQVLVAVHPALVPEAEDEEVQVHSFAFLVVPTHAQLTLPPPGEGAGDVHLLPVMQLALCFALQPRAPLELAEDGTDGADGALLGADERAPTAIRFAGDVRELDRRLVHHLVADFNTRNLVPSLQHRQPNADPHDVPEAEAVGLGLLFDHAEDDDLTDGRGHPIELQVDRLHILGIIGKVGEGPISGMDDQGGVHVRAHGRDNGHGRAVAGV